VSFGPLDRERIEPMRVSSLLRTQSAFAFFSEIDGVPIPGRDKLFPPFLARPIRNPRQLTNRGDHPLRDRSGSVKRRIGRSTSAVRCRLTPNGESNAAKHVGVE